MNRILLLLLLVLGLQGFSQQYNNEWIKYNQTYYKFKVGRYGLYRIPKSVLDAAGIGNTPVENFELWRNGEPVVFSTPVNTGLLPANGYIEFWGQANDGKADKSLYREAQFQHSDKLSLFTDTSAYFLSVNTTGTGAKAARLTNNVASNVLPAEPYFMHTAGRYFNNRQNHGFAAVVGEYVYSSSFDKGEYFSSGEIYPSGPLSIALPTTGVYAAGPAAQLNFGASGNALNARHAAVRLNGTLVKDTVMDYFNDLNTNVSIPLSSLTASTTLQFNNTSAISTDRMVISYADITYAKTFDFENASNFDFQLPPRPSGAYVEITGFANGSSAPVLYDLTNGRVYTGDIAVAGKIRFALQATNVNTQYILVSQEAANINTINSLTERKFIDYSAPSNQGNYLIISHPFLHTGTHGNDPIEDYKNYRQSTSGGAHNVKIINIEEITDQFAFGIKKHPNSVRNFLRYARAGFTIKPKFVFLIGRGMEYTEYRNHEAEAVSERLNMIPSFGVPCSDNLLSSGDVTSPIPITPIGRLSVVAAKEIEDYLEKILEYETTQRSAPNTVAGRLWMKNVIHVTGATDPYLGTVLCNYMGSYKTIIEDTLFGARVSTFCKTSTNPVEKLSSERLGTLLQEGVSIMNYFGHSSATTLEFNLDNPQAYNNQGKYPIFFVNGCQAGNFFTYYPARLTVNETLSEKFVLAKQRGSIAFVASTHFGIVNYLNLLLHGLYQNLTDGEFGRTLGETQKSALQKMVTITGPYDFYARLHAEEMTIHGDPAITINEQPKPDYVLDASMIKFNPTFISIAENQFQLKLSMANLGKATKDSFNIEVKQQYPNGTQQIIFKGKVPPVYFQDSLTINIPIQPERDKGQNKITVTLDSENEVNEVDEANNSITKEFFIFEDEARPVYPYNYAITNNKTQHLFASTANAMSPKTTYVMEIDTTEQFNSSLKVQKTSTSVGGLLEFDPGISYLDSTVYHWRVAIVPSAGGEYRWNHSSFRYIPGTIDGFNQSNFYQNDKSTKERVSLDSASQWKFNNISNSIFLRNGVYPTAANQAVDFSLYINEIPKSMSVCGISGIIFYVINPVTLEPWFNNYGWSPGRLGSDYVCGSDREYQFQFNILDPNGRKNAMSFMDSIPDGYFVGVINVSGTDAWTNTYAADWAADTSWLGQNNSLYHRLLVQGFTGIDNFKDPRAFIFFFKKNRQYEFAPKFTFSEGINDRITLAATATTVDTLGYITSPKFGPAKSWKQAIWSGHSLETPSSDNATVEVVGVAPTSFETVLYTMDKFTSTMDLSAVDANAYPYIKLRMRNADPGGRTPFQLDYWQVFYNPVPEGAIAPNLYFLSKDTLEAGEKLKFGVAFKNISKTAFDSLVVKVVVNDKDNVTHPIDLPKIRPLVDGDSVRIYFELDTKTYPGLNTVFVNFNPDNLHPEQTIFNNFLYKNFYVVTDRTNPLLDVTFDGVHILNKDIVSAKPHIQMKLKDDAKFLLLNDTSLVSVQIRYPDGKLRTFHFDSDTLRFIPATATDNSAVIDFNPSFLTQENPEGDEYELIVSGKDKSGNKSGVSEYRVTFKVISKPMISNLFNYPNPFSTSTAFVFTLTGSEIPQNLKIQILTVTGKIVREITKAELGPVKIGRNITEFKWNGTDQYGQKLANGVYLYRVVTTLNGKSMEKYKAEGDNTDKFFNNGYGKMYLMR